MLNRTIAVIIVLSITLPVVVLIHDEYEQYRKLKNDIKEAKELMFSIERRIMNIECEIIEILGMQNECIEERILIAHILNKTSAQVAGISMLNP